MFAWIALINNYSSRQAAEITSSEAQPTSYEQSRRHSKLSSAPDHVNRR